jgi:DNA-binding response OmpR family regulator
MSDNVAPRVLLIEDNTDLAAGITYNLRLEGFDTRAVETGGEGLAEIRGWSPHVVILDLMLPDTDGYRLLEIIRGEGNRVPVLVLTARADEADKVRGFRLDADQYVTKPFGLLELIERVRSLARRGITLHQGGEPAIRIGDIEIDPATRLVLRAGNQVSLTPKAYDLLMALVKRDGGVASRLELLREVWGHRAFVMTRTVDSHVAELRRKLEVDPAAPQHILTVWKVGYRLKS